ncbi:MAG: EamA/RhaT family transporter [Proteobacteria bacterium]|nr:MAG: EamA/RhaT family transporter [Pseudomonadota bacterium]
MVGAAFTLTGMSACVQIASRTLPHAEVVFVRNALALLFLLPWLLRHGLAALRTERPAEHLIRGAAGVASMYCFFYAIAHMRLADAVVLNYTASLFFPLLEAVWLRERMSPRLWWPLLLGFLGVVLVLRPGTDMFQPIALVGLTAGFLSAVAQIGVRTLTLTEPPARIVFLFALTASAISAVPLPFVWVTPSSALLGLFALMGLCAVFGQLMLTRAYSHAPASQVGAFVYVAVLFAAVFDWIQTGRLPHPTFAAGAVLICAGGALMLRLAAPAAKTSGSQAPAR